MIIRSSDLAGGSTAWTGAVAAPARSTPSTAPSLFDDAAGGAEFSITADAQLGQRGLSVVEHADRILALLRGAAGPG